MCHNRARSEAESMKTVQSWIEVLVEANEICPEALHTLSAALVDHGACGAILDQETPEADPAGPPPCQACGHLTRLKVYFPAAGHTIEEVLSLVDRTATQSKEIYDGLVVRVLRIHTIDCGDWAERWKACFPPKRVSTRLLVVPPWDIPAVPPDCIPIFLEPGRAFGTGQHPSTALCLELLDGIAQTQGGLPHSFLDVGYGSGILCIAAQKLGATHIVGVDIDQDVAEDALRNFAHNHVNNKIRLVTGPLECIRRRFDMVTANLDFRLLTQSVGHMKELIHRNGGLIISGILEEEAPEILHLFQRTGFHTEDERTLEEWTALYMRRKDNG